MQGDGLRSLIGEPVDVVGPEGDGGAFGNNLVQVGAADSGIGLGERAPHHMNRS